MWLNLAKSGFHSQTPTLFIKLTISWEIMGPASQDISVHWDFSGLNGSSSL